VLPWHDTASDRGAPRCRPAPNPDVGRALDIVSVSDRSANPSQLRSTGQPFPPKRRRRCV
jgi:hypothetical protein